MQELSNIESDSPFDESYYESLSETYDVMRPVRKALRNTFLFLPRHNRVAVIFGLGQIINFKLWKRSFSTVYAYDINKHIGRKLADTPVAPYFFVQDVAVPFTPKCHGHLCACYWLFEHLSNAQVAQSCLNMMAHAPLNVIRITTGDDPRYYTDPTHSNPKSVSSWTSFLDPIYESQDWRPLFHAGNIWSYARANLVSSLADLHAHLDYQLERIWSPYHPPSTAT